MTDYADEFDRIADNLVKDFYATKQTDVPPVVYHYTDAAGLRAILEHSKVRATDTRFLNDRHELTHLISSAHASVHDIARENKNGKLTDFYRQIDRFRSVPSPNSYFVFSLSSERDDLSQWRGYARDGCGFTLGLSGSAIYKLARKDFVFTKVEYDLNRQQNILRLAHDEIRDALLAELAKKPQSMFDVYQEAAITYDWVIEHAAAASKHQSFRAESEWRVIMSTSNQNPEFKIHSRISGTRIVPYAELSLADANGRIPLVEIGVGPGFSSGEQIQAVEFLLREFDYKAKVYSADSPYRQV
jgi:Protein of unknown function (DUF2971)